jgi:hypothetical protein
MSVHREDHELAAIVVPDGRRLQRRYGAVAARLYARRVRLVTHRLVSINADGTVDTKGDANSSIDPWHVPKRSIIGGVVLAPHLVGFFLVYLRTPPGAASILLSILFAWQTWALLRTFDEKHPRPSTGAVAGSS